MKTSEPKKEMVIRNTFRNGEKLIVDLTPLVNYFSEMEDVDSVKTALRDLHYYFSDHLLQGYITAIEDRDPKKAPDFESYVLDPLRTIKYLADALDKCKIVNSAK